MDIDDTENGKERPPAELSTDEARQGETSGHVRSVLAASLMLAVVAGAVLLVTAF
jgi:hypothetical protein